MYKNVKYFDNSQTAKMECNQQACPAVCKQKRKIKEEENHQFDK